MKLKHTERGFAFYEFTDYYGTECTIQKSSLATADAIWLGASRVEVRGFTPFGKPDSWTILTRADLEDRLGFQDVVSNNRMHLTRSQVEDLLPILQRFVDTGELLADDDPLSETEGE